MAQTTYLYRAPLRGSGIAYEEWKDEAACKDLPIQLFELGDVDGAEGQTGDYQHQLIASGLKVCAACPVRQACKVNSSELDRYWTTRGGQPPEGLFPDSLRPKPELHKTGTGGGGVKDVSNLPALKEKCHKDHKNWRVRSDGRSRYCATCKAESDKRSEATRPSRKRNRNKKAGTIES